MLSLNQQKQLFNNKQLNHPLLSSGSFLFDPLDEQMVMGRITYPLTGVAVLEAGLDGIIFKTSYDFVFADLVQEDRSNKDDVMSSLLQAAMDFYSQIKYDLEVYFQSTVTLTSNFEPMEAFNNDSAYGWNMKLDVIQDYDRSTCNTSSGHAGQVIIYNSDGSVAAYLNPNSTYTLESVATDTADTNTNLSGTTFTLSHTPVFITGVFLNGQRLTLTTDYTVNGTTITFNNALANDIVVVVYSY